MGISHKTVNILVIFSFQGKLCFREWRFTIYNGYLNQLRGKFPDDYLPVPGRETWLRELWLRLCRWESVHTDNQCSWQSVQLRISAYQESVQMRIRQLRISAYRENTQQELNAMQESAEDIHALQWKHSYTLSSSSVTMHSYYTADTDEGSGTEFCACVWHG